MTNKFNEKVSLFKNTFDKRPTIARLGAILEKIKKSPQLKRACILLQTINDPEERRIFKQVHLPAITVSGVFRDGHAQTNSIHHNGLVQVDFDEKDFPPLLLLEDIIKLLKSDPYTFVGFISPSGTGYKLFVRIPTNPSNHLSHFRALEKYYRDKYGFKIDPSCKDLGRLCFLSYDPLLYMNVDAKVFHFMDAPLPDRNVYKNVHSNANLKAEIECVVLQIERMKIDITDSYQNEWLKLGFALADGLGECGRSFFHRISIFSKKYTPVNTDKQYDQCLKGRRSGITIRSFFGLAKSYGINIYPNQLKNIRGHEE
jgi:hypothetical protein